jgi:ubiquinol-cytochrome c reductase cytochrome b/c1 subunit
MAGGPARQYNNRLVRWIEYRLPIFSAVEATIGRDMPTPKNLNYWWSLGSVLFLALIIQIATGIFLAMHYIPNGAMAFDSVEHIMRNVNHGWLLRYVHANGASLFFAAAYIHILRGMYYGSYKAPRELLWIIGVVILVIMMATAFMGYVLPWGQMSFWAATVITNLFSAIPWVGSEITTWLWGGFAVDSPTLQRFFSLHYLLPFVIFGVSLLHVWALHVHGPTNPMGISARSKQDTVPYHPYYTSKYMSVIGLALIILAFFVFYEPLFLSHADNFIAANPLQTPPNIVPEWYFLPFYAILRSVPDKLGGVILFGASIAILFLLPWLDTSRVRSARFRPTYRYFFWIFVLDVIVLGWVGAQHPEGTPLLIGRLATIYYFAHFIIILPFVGWFERPRPLPESISKPVLKSGAAATEAAE